MRGIVSHLSYIYDRVDASKLSYEVALERIQSKCGDNLIALIERCGYDPGMLPMYIDLFLSTRLCGVNGFKLNSWIKNSIS